MKVEIILKSQAQASVESNWVFVLVLGLVVLERLQKLGIFPPTKIPVYYY